MSKPHSRLIWIDLEMTGLRCDQDAIIEIATLVTDLDLNLIAQGPEVAIAQPDTVLAGMDEWNRLHHGASGLIERVRTSPYDTATAEQMTLGFLKQYVPPGQSPMCGNSICQDRRFLARHMPTLEAYFHYRNLDVSTVKLLSRYWAPAVAAGLVKPEHHLALADIQASIAELRYYREHLFYR